MVGGPSQTVTDCTFSSRQWAAVRMVVGVTIVPLHWPPGDMFNSTTEDRSGEHSVPLRISTLGRLDVPPIRVQALAAGIGAGLVGVGLPPPPPPHATATASHDSAPLSFFMTGQQITPVRRRMRVVNRVLTLLASVLSVACTQPRMQIAPTIPPCRMEAAGADSVRWVAPDDAVTRRLLASWCDTVGPAGFHRRSGPSPSGATVVVTWNLHAGAGDVRALLAQLREAERSAGRPDPNVILLLQEAIRIGIAPSRVPDGSTIPRRIASPRAAIADILEVARLEDLNAVYIPSMRNGREGSNGREGVPEDRGNAILSTMPISDVAAIELPFAAQRRVAVSARIGDPPMALRVVSVHLDTFGGHGRQATALLDALAQLGTDGPVLIA